jgi:hypothetical protein
MSSRNVCWGLRNKRGVFMSQVLLYQEMREALELIYEKMEKGQLYVLNVNNEPDIPGTVLLISKISTVILRAKHQDKKND